MNPEGEESVGVGDGRSFDDCEELGEMQVI